MNMLDTTNMSMMPQWIDDNHIDPRWIAAKTGLKSCSECIVVDVSNETRRAAKTRDGATLRLTLTHGDKTTNQPPSQHQPQTLIIKQIPPQGQALARQLGLAREAYFYQHLVRDEFDLAKIYYAHGDFQEGQKVIVMQDLSHDFIDSGILFGPGNPNNWKRDLPGIVAQRFGGAGTNPPPTSAHVAKVTFQKIAHIHAAYWKRADLLLNNEHDEPNDGKSWLRGHDWLQGKGQESWQASQDLIKNGWQKVVEKEKESSNTAVTINWDPLLRQTVDKAVRGISWQAQLRRLNVNESHWTLVHGDCWPGNVMWKVSKVDDDNESSSAASPVRLIDWEMVGLGSGPQELGQYVISNMDPVERRACERDLIESYYKELLLCSKRNGDSSSKRALSTYTFDECWMEYCIGGLERWIWFLIYFLSMEMYDWAQYCHDQMAAFQKDHNVTIDQITQPRP